MTTSITELISLLLIIIAAVFGILGAATTTKTKEGKLTKWGIIAIVGIVISNTFSFIKTYKTQQDEHQKSLIAREEHNQQIEEENRKYKNTLAVMNSTLKSSDSALKNQIKTQRQAEVISHDLLSSIEIQKSLTSNLNQANNNIERTLNPLRPFGIAYSIILYKEDFHPKYDSVLFQELTNIENLIAMTKGKDSVNLESKYAIVHVRNSRFYEITERYSGYENFKLFENITSTIFINKKKKKNNDMLNFLDSTGINFNAKAILKSNRNEEYGDGINIANFGITIYYDPNSKEIILNTITRDLFFTLDFGHIKSTLDLKGKFFYVWFHSPFKIHGLFGYSLMYGYNFSETYNLKDESLKAEDTDEYSTTL